MGRKTYQLKVEGIELESTDMSTVAALIEAYAAFLGKSAKPTLRSVTPGSICIDSEVLLERSEDVEEKFRSVNDPLGIDPQVTALLDSVKRAGGRVIELRGNEQSMARREIAQKPKRIVSVTQQTEIQGKLVSLSGSDESKNARIQHATGSWLAICTEEVGKSLAKHLWDYVRVSGPARWSRDPDTHKWDLKQLKIEHFEKLDTSTIAEVLESVSDIEGFQPERFSDADAFLDKVRG